ncbi:hypothetical protein H6P81_003325 [Aristolochia fimbriata]|uniref:Protein WVD2-like 7 n=1 Tax=Aristolochia fimbriata TaxID=158543 RepID=A0AAV7FFK0_ARIFI|nr:hypothetical protein H6P81_003325 [Aristolochia fimbriata]
MTTEMGRAYCEWPQVDELSNQNDFQEASLSQLLDHGSVSFGKFAVESLSWEKWSVFSHNRWKEELEKFKAPGLVAQKKAYFEEYYRKVRAFKALQFQQDGQTMDSCQTRDSGDSSVCSQGPEDEQSTPTVESCIDGQVDVVQVEVRSAKFFGDQEMLPVNVPQAQHLDPLSKLSCSGYPRSSYEGEMKDIENPKMHEEKIIIDINHERAPETVQPEKYEHLDDERIKIEDTVQKGASLEDEMHRKSGIEQKIIPGCARLEVNRKINENLASVTKKKAVQQGSVGSRLKQNVARKESSGVTVRSSTRADLKGKEASGINSTKTAVNDSKKATPSFSHKSSKKDASVTSVERIAKMQTRKSHDATKSPQVLEHIFPAAPNRTSAISSRIEASSGQSTIEKLKHPVPETRQTRNAINPCVGASNAYSATSKSREISSFPSNRSSRESSSVSLWEPSKEILCSVTFTRTLSLSGERRACNRDCAQSSSHCSLSNRLSRSSADAKSLSTKESSGKAITSCVRDTAAMNRRCVNSTQTKPGVRQHARNERGTGRNRQKERSS